MQLQDGSRHDAHHAAERAARTSYGRLLALVVSRTRDISLAEEALGEAFARALERWPAEGVPSNPDAWLLTAARRVAIDSARHSQVRRNAQPELVRRATLTTPDEVLTMPDDDIPDERLKMLFLCAHPAIDPAVRAPLMMQTVLGLDAERIASAFLVAPATMAQRLVRIKQKIREAGMRFGLPPRAELPERLDAVLESIYVAYAAGWDRYDGVTEPGDLANEAVWLAQELAELMPDEPEVLGLLALVLFGESRRSTRRDAAGRYVPLAEQDQSAWDEQMITRAEQLLARAATAGRLGRFQLEAAVQSAHAARRRTGRTDWDGIVHLYEGLLTIAPSMGAAVALAAAVAERDGPAAGWDTLQHIDEDAAACYQPYWATRGHLLLQLGAAGPARSAFTRALGLSDNPATRVFLLEKLNSTPEANLMD